MIFQTIILWRKFIRYKKQTSWKLYSIFEMLILIQAAQLECTMPMW